jgi:hypothetical protein
MITRTPPIYSRGLCQPFPAMTRHGRLTKCEKTRQKDSKYDEAKQSAPGFSLPQGEVVAAQPFARPCSG